MLDGEGGAGGGLSRGGVGNRYDDNFLHLQGSITVNQVLMVVFIDILIPHIFLVELILPKRVHCTTALQFFL